MKKAQALAAQAETILESTSVPGEILLAGVMVQDQAAATGVTQRVLDPRIKLRLQSGRTGEKVESKPLEDAKAQRLIRQTSIVHDSVPTSLAKIEKGTDLVIGCENETAVKELLAAGRKAKVISEDVIIARDQGVHLMIADRVILCGEMAPGGLALIEANELVFANFALNTTGFGLPIQVNTAKLTLIGQNLLAAKGMPISQTAKGGASIQLTVTSSIDGEGTLEILTEGGDLVRNGIGRR